MSALILIVVIAACILGPLLFAIGFVEHARRFEEGKIDVRAAARRPLVSALAFAVIFVYGAGQIAAGNWPLWNIAFLLFALAMIGFNIWLYRAVKAMMRQEQ